ncbi:hypothetical protein EDB89DRAFT_1911233 [Lactarius sanguifluus]|nr:hypothetical protein EDB89DRAFT_1911233 [Lactarius sanguifluus]
MAPQPDPTAMPHQYHAQDHATANSPPRHVNPPRHLNTAHKTLATNPSPRHLNMACKTPPPPIHHIPSTMQHARPHHHRPTTSHKTPTANPPPPTCHVMQDPDHQPTTTPPQCGTQDPATADPPRHPVAATSAPTIPPNHHADNRVQAPLVDRPNTLHPNPIPATASQSPLPRLHSSLTVVLVYVHLF